MLLTCYAPAQEIIKIERKSQDPRQGVKVFTGPGPFFISAEKMYISCGLEEIKREPQNGQIKWDKIYLEKTL